MPLVAAAVAALEPEHVAHVLSEQGQIRIWVAGRDQTLGADDVVIAMAPLDGYQVAREGKRAVALELQLDEELRQEGLAREVIRAVQAARKAAGLEVSERITLTLAGDEMLLAAARVHEDHVASETLATSVSYDEAIDGHAVEIERRRLLVAAHRTAHT
jgi:isoleucyl-tRNA synthetase